MFGSLLRNFQREIAGVYNFLLYACDFVSKDQGVLDAGFSPEGVQFHRIHRLLHSYHRVAIGLQAIHQSHHIGHLLEGHHFLGAQGYFAQFGGGRHRADTAQVHFVHAEGIGRTEGAAHVVGTADVVQHQHHAALGPGVAVFIGRNTTQFYVEKFSVLHGHKGKAFPTKKRIFVLPYSVSSLEERGFGRRKSKVFFMKNDLQVFDLIKKEQERQSSGLELIASENYVSEQVLAAMGSVCTNKYAEGYPGKRYYGGCEIVDQIEQLAIDRLCALFEAEYANVQPHSGAQANMAVTMAILKPGDTFMGLDLSMGGHLTHGSPVNASGLLYHPVAYGLNPETGRVDYDEMERKALECKPKLIIGGASAYSREWDYERMRAIADKVGAILWIDMAHTAGLIAAGLLKNPVKYAHIVTSTTHKTLRGPRGGIILMGKDFDNPWGLTTPKGEVKKMSAILNSSVFPGIQGGPLEHVIAAKAVAFFEASQPEYVEYQKQVVANAAAMCQAFIDKNYKIISGGTDNHLMLIDLRTKFPALTGRVAEKELVRADITVNKNMVPFDSRSPFATSGLRVGTPAITSRGFEEKDMLAIVELIDTVLASANEHFEALTAKEPTEAQNTELAAHQQVLDEVKRKVHMMTAGRPLNRY